MIATQLPNRQRTYRAVFAPAPASVTSDDATSPSAPAGDLPPAPSTEDAGSSADEADDAAAEDDEPHPTPEETEAPVQAEATAPNDPVEAEPQLSEMVSRVQATAISYVSADVRAELRALVRGRLSRYGHLTTSERSHHALRDLSRDGLVLLAISRHLRSLRVSMTTDSSDPSDSEIIAAFLGRLDASVPTLCPAALCEQISRISGLGRTVMRPHLERAIMLGHDPATYQLLLVGQCQDLLSDYEVRCFVRQYIAEIRSCRDGAHFGHFSRSLLAGFEFWRCLEPGASPGYSPGLMPAPPLAVDANRPSAAYTPSRVLGHRLDGRTLRLLMTYETVAGRENDTSSIVQPTVDMASMDRVKPFFDDHPELLDHCIRDVGPNGERIGSVLV
ncbi:hypothetical protein J8273_5579 [Carpediemonas membranifera]|uniref:Uncharacterized protein n=1 Tax=Carpediemonas membranifera TaxID=201153 RepID=A0A8J6AW21_9EUKA|nr:hypothetical protein J8273_5579 [Carpediemonas membranifera]|eukprot:KAG9392985.1 hypothetical protein J8273_5579 [Carpediemonas membranifera]